MASRGTLLEPPSAIGADGTRRELGRDNGQEAHDPLYQGALVFLKMEAAVTQARRRKSEYLSRVDGLGHPQNLLRCRPSLLHETNHRVFRCSAHDADERAPRPIRLGAGTERPASRILARHWPEGPPGRVIGPPSPPKRLANQGPTIPPATMWM